jgi:hypothetical protein
MAHFRTTVPSPAPTGVAYDYLADFTSILDWDPSVSAASLVSGEPGQLGARYRVVVSLPLRSIPLEYEIVQAEPPARPGGPALVALRAENSDVVSYDVITFEPRAEGGTDVTYDAELTGQGFRKYFDPVFAVVMQVIGARARSGLAAAVGQLPADAR